ncbi:MAG: 30S ribosome-binding factor RbfA [Pseudomonadota bacterium]
MHKESNRPRRVAELIKRELAMLLPREDPEGVGRRVTITDTEATRDLRTVHVYFSVLGGADEAATVLPALQRATPRLRHLLTRRLVLRMVPEIRFHYDASLAQGDRIERLLAASRRRDSGTD